MFHEKNWTLRCVWVPTHTGVNAPLTAVWIKTLSAQSHEAPETASLEGDSWVWAA